MWFDYQFWFVFGITAGIVFIFSLTFAYLVTIITGNLFRHRDNTGGRKKARLQPSPSHDPASEPLKGGAVKRDQYDAGDQLLPSAPTLDVIYDVPSGK